MKAVYRKIYYIYYFYLVIDAGVSVDSFHYENIVFIHF